MEVDRPSLPIEHVYRVWTGPPWRREFSWQRDSYEDWDVFFEDVEWLDTFGDEHQWIEDRAGAKWDVRTSEFLFGNFSETHFERRVSEPTR